MPRKRVHLDPDEIERLGQLGCTVQEIADLFGLAQSSMSERLSREPLKSAWKRGQATAKVSVRRNLMRLAMEENQVAAAIWLSKVLCRDQEPPKESRVQAAIEQNTNVRWVACWGGWDEHDRLKSDQTDDGRLIEDGEWDEN